MGAGWQDYLRNAGSNLELEQCTYAGPPFGDAEFVAEIGDRFSRKWVRGALPSDAQGSLLTD